MYMATTTPRKPAMMTVRTIHRKRTNTTTKRMLVTSIRRSSGTVSSERRVLVRRSMRRRSRLSTTGSAMGELRECLSPLSTFSASGSLASAVEVGLDHTYDLRRRRTEHIAKPDVTLAHPIVEADLSELMAARPVHPGELPLIEQAALGVLGMHRHHRTPLEVAFLRGDERTDSERSVDLGFFHHGNEEITKAVAECAEWLNR